jgi:ribosomal protein S18 acetylase RimI-like enzyme
MAHVAGKGPKSIAGRRAGINTKQYPPSGAEATGGLFCSIYIGPSESLLPMTYDDGDNPPGVHLAAKPQDQTMVSVQGAKEQTQIRNMTRADLDRAGEILFKAYTVGASKHGYVPRMQSTQEGTAWAWAMLRHGPGEILIAEVEGRAVGICCLNPRGDHGGVGPVAVDPSYQGRGIGRQLMNALLKKADGLQSVRLFQEAFNPASFSLYYSLNFMPVAELLDLFLNTGVRKGMDPCGTVSVLTANDLDAVSAYNIPRSKLDRSQDLAYYVKWGKVFVCRDQSQIRGFLASLPGSRTVQLGPLVAEGEEEARLLFQHAVAFFKERPCQTRVMTRDSLLVRALEGLGFKLYCLNILMVRGSWRPGQYVEAFGGFPEGT